MAHTGGRKRLKVGLLAHTGGRKRLKVGLLAHTEGRKRLKVGLLAHTGGRKRAKGRTADTKTWGIRTRDKDRSDKTPSPSTLPPSPYS